MPIYCYRCYRDENGKLLKEGIGEVYELPFVMGEAPERIDMSVGRGIPQMCCRDRSAEVVTQSVSVKNGNGHVKRAWPMPPCVGSGVHASDGQKLAKHLKDRGCPTEVIDGDPVYTSAAHRRKALKIRGFVDKS